MKKYVLWPIGLVIMVCTCAIILWNAWESVAKKLKNEVFNVDLEAKVCTILRHYTNPSIVIAGDSRGLYHINPERLSELTNKQTINTALEFCDIVTTANVISKYPELYKADIILLSASVYQINDNIIDYGYFPAAAFFKTTLPEQIFLYWDHPLDLIDRYRTAKALYERTVYNNGLFTCKDHDYLPEHTIAAMGFRPQDRIWDGRIDSPNYAWYRNFKSYGPKKRIFKNALNSMESIGPRVILVISPFSPSWKHDAVGSRTLDIENKFIAFAASAMKNPQSSTISFFNEPDATFPDSLFIDPLHLNAKGAERLTDMIADSINKVLAIGNNNR